MIFRKLVLVCGLAALPLPGIAEEKKLDARDQWAQWRGPLGNGVSPGGKPPLTWSEGKNVRWKTALPGKGHSTPVVWGNRIFVTAAIPYGDPVAGGHEDSPGAHHNLPPSRHQEFIVVALDRRDGSILWKRSVRRARPHESMHETGSWASNSPVTDGKHLYASFGSIGVFALDLDGTPVWQTDLGDMRIKHGHGEGSSPALHGGSLVVNWDHEDESFVTALDTRTGEPRWKVTRDEATSWSSPLIVEHAGKLQVIVAATGRVRGYDLAHGKLIWECGGLSGNVIASPVAADGYVYVANSYETRSMLAIRLAAAKGDITGTDAVAWRRNRDTPYVPSPVLYGEMLCFLKHYQGLLTCVNAKSGETLFGPRRLDGIGNVYASPVGAADRIYVVDLDGTTAVIARRPEFELLASNQLEDAFSASPAIVGNELYLRGERYLYCIAAE